MNSAKGIGTKIEREWNDPIDTGKTTFISYYEPKWMFLVGICIIALNLILMVIAYGLETLTIYDLIANTLVGGVVGALISPMMKSAYMDVKGVK